MARGSRTTRAQIKTFLEQIAGGATIVQAAEAAGASIDVFYARARKDSAVYDELFATMFAEAMEQRAAVRADKVDEKFDDWIDEEECPAPIRLAWAKRWNPAYRDKQQVEVTGDGGGPVQIEARKVDIAALIRLAAERGLADQLGPAGPGGALPGPDEVLPDHRDGQ